MLGIKKCGGIQLRGIEYDGMPKQARQQNQTKSIPEFVNHLQQILHESLLIFLGLPPSV